MRKSGVILLFVSGVIFAAYFYFGSLDAQGPQVPTEEPLMATQIVTETALPVIPTETVVVSLPTATLPVAQPVSPFDGYKVGGIDFDSGKPLAMVITTVSGEKIFTTWAVANGPATDPEVKAEDGTIVVPLGSKFNDPHSGTIFTVKAEDGTPVLYAHSGQIFHKWILFGSTLDWYVRHDTANNEIRLSEALAKVDALRNSTAILCQIDDPKDFPTWFDGNCQGVVLNLRISAAALVLENQVYDYGNALGDKPLSWLNSSLIDPRGGKVSSAFSFINTNNGFLLSTCIQRFQIDQADKAGVPDHEFNRLAVWFEFIQ